MDKKDDDYSRIPVFAFPSPIVFHANDREGCKQILTIYNPYDFPIRFKILSTAPSNYTVIDSEGSVKAKNSVDLIVRLTSSFTSDASHQTSVEDKFRVQIYNYDTRQLLGRKDVPSIVQFGNSAFPSSSGASYAGPSSLSHFGSGSESLHGGLPGTKGSSSSELQFLPPGGGGGNSMFYGGGRGDHHPNYIAVLTALVCIVGLLLPTHNGDSTGRSGDSTSSTYLHSLPAYFHLSVNQKLLIAYTLGLVTMVIFRPQ